MKVCLSCGNRFKSSDWECPVCHHKPEQKNSYPLFAPELAESNTGFDANYFSQLASIEGLNVWFRARNKLLIWVLRRYFLNAKNFMEIGCGTGFVLSEIERTFPKLSLSGSEIYCSGLTYAAKRLKKAELFQMDARKIPFENEFDVVGAFDVLEHIDEDSLVLSQMHQAIRHEGGIILTVPQHAFLWSKIDEYSCHVRRYNATDLKKKVEQAGFKVLRMTSFVSLLLPLLGVSRLMRGQPSGKPEMMAELKLSGSVNTVLENILALERGMIRTGLSFPAGGSLLVIARKIY